MSQLDSLREELIQSDESFRSLYQEHRKCKQRLEVFRTHSLPSQEDETEIKRIKVHKLTLKDQMEAIIRARAHATA